MHSSVETRRENDPVDLGQSLSAPLILDKGLNVGVIHFRNKLLAVLEFPLPGAEFWEGQNL